MFEFFHFLGCYLKIVTQIVSKSLISLLGFRSG